MPKFYMIIAHDNCPKIFFPNLWRAYASLPPPISNAYVAQD